MNPVRILFLIDKLSPAGTQTSLLEMAKRLDRSRFEPIVVSLTSGGALAEEFRKAGVRLLELQVKRAYGISGLKAFLFLSRLMKEEKIDIVQTYFLQADLIGILAAKVAGVKKIVTTRRDEGFWRRKRQIQTNRWLNSFCDVVLANSLAVRSAVLECENVSRTKVRVIYNGVDTDEFFPSPELRQAARIKLGIADDELVIAVGANMRHRIKGQEYVIKALPEILTHLSKVKVLLVGDGPLRAGYERLAASLGVRDRVLFLGSRRDMCEILAAADIACLPSLSEGFSNFILEAMAAAKPVVAASVGGNPEMVTPENGFLVAPANAFELAEKICGLAQNELLRRQCGEESRRRAVHEFSAEKMAREYESFFEELAAAGRQSSAARKKILHLIWALEPGGAERQVASIAHRQKQNGNQVVVVCLTKKGPLAEELEEHGVSVLWIEKKPGVDFSIVGRLASFIRKSSIGIIHTHVPTASLWGRLAALRAGGCRVIVHEHSDLAATQKMFQWINRLLAPWTDRYIAVSEDIRGKMIRAGVAPNKIRVVPNGLAGHLSFSDESRQRIRKELGIPEHAPVIGTVGRLEPRKDHATFLEACRRVREFIPEARFILVGDGRDRAALEKKAGDLGLRESVHFAGTREEVTPWFAAMDIFVLSSLTEGISISLLEAMSAEKACVVTRVGGNPEVITDEMNGRLVPARDPEKLAAVIAELVLHPDTAARLGAAARQDVEEKFSLDAMMAKMAAVYLELGIEIRPLDPAAEPDEVLQHD